MSNTTTTEKAETMTNITPATCANCKEAITFNTELDEWVHRAVEGGFLGEPLCEPFMENLHKAAAGKHEGIYAEPAVKLTHEERLANFLLSSTVDPSLSTEENYRRLIAAAVAHANDSVKHGLNEDLRSYASANADLTRRINMARGTIQTVLKKRDPESIATPPELKWAIGSGEIHILGIYRLKKTNNSYARDENLAHKVQAGAFEGVEGGDYVKFQIGDKVGQLELQYLDGNDWKVGAYARKTIRRHKDGIKYAAQAAAEKEIREAEEKARKLAEAKRKTIDKEIRDAKKQLDELLALKALDTTSISA